MPQETKDALKYSTVTKPNGTKISNDRVELPDGTVVSKEQYEAMEKAEDEEFGQRMREETDRSAGREQTS